WRPRSDRRRPGQIQSYISWAPTVPEWNALRSRRSRRRQNHSATRSYALHFTSPLAPQTVVQWFGFAFLPQQQALGPTFASYRLTPPRRKSRLRTFARP